MLNNFFLNFKFHRFFQSGGYIDFFLKKFSEVFLKNVFIYVSQFFAEKYLIEILTKKVIDSSIFTLNQYLGWFKLEYFNFFLQFLYILFYLISFFNFIIIL